MVLSTLRRSKVPKDANMVLSTLRRSKVPKDANINFKKDLKMRTERREF